MASHPILAEGGTQVMVGGVTAGRERTHAPGTFRQAKGRPIRGGQCPPSLIADARFFYQLKKVPTVKMFES